MDNSDNTGGHLTPLVEVLQYQSCSESKYWLSDFAIRCPLGFQFVVILSIKSDDPNVIISCDKTRGHFTFHARLFHTNQGAGGWY